MFHGNDNSRKINRRHLPFGPDSFSAWPLPRQPFPGIGFPAVPVHLQIKAGGSGHASEGRPAAPHAPARD